MSKAALLFGSDQNCLHVVRIGEYDDVMDFLRRMDKLNLTLATREHNRSWVYSWVGADHIEDVACQFRHRLWKGGGHE